MKPARIALILIALIVSLPICFAQSMSLTYDANGNLVTGDGKYRIYNDLNQLTEVRNGSNATAPLMERYEYHPIEERIWLKDVYNNGVWKETVYYDNENFVQTDNSSGSASTLYVSHDGQQVVQQTNSTAEYLISDPYGAYKLVTNSVGTVIENTSYEPFGRIIAGGERTRFDYEDREYSSVVSDYDFRFRKYDPNLKLFTQPDRTIPKLYHPQTLNRYAFELNNPYRYVDPTGLWAVSLGVAGSGFAAILGIGGHAGFAASYDEIYGFQFGWVHGVEGSVGLGGEAGISGWGQWSPSSRKVEDLGGGSGGISATIGVVGVGGSGPLTADSSAKPTLSVTFPEAGAAVHGTFGYDWAFTWYRSRTVEVYNVFILNVRKSDTEPSTKSSSGGSNSGGSKTRKAGSGAPSDVTQTIKFGGVDIPVSNSFAKLLKDRGLLK